MAEIDNHQYVVVFGTNPHNDVGREEGLWLEEERERARVAVGLMAVGRMVLVIGGETFSTGFETITEAKSMKRRILQVGEGQLGEDDIIELSNGLETIEQSLDVSKYLKKEVKNMDEPVLLVSTWHQCIRAAIVLVSEGHKIKCVPANLPHFDVKTVKDIMENFVAGVGYTVLWTILHKLGVWNETQSVLAFYQDDRRRRRDSIKENK